MNEFENFLEENNYEDDLEFQLCDLEVAFSAGKELQWKPSDEQIKALGIAIRCGIQLGTWEEKALKSLYDDLEKN